METYFDLSLEKYLELQFKSPSLNKRGQVRKRKPKEPKVYFTQDTENAIIQYLASADEEERNKIYNRKIAYSFYKLVENIINTFRFYYTDTDTIEELKYEVISFLLEKLHLFNHSKSIDDKFTKIVKKKFKENYLKGSFIEYTKNAIVVTQEQINSYLSALDISSECRLELESITPPKAFSYFGTIAKRYLINYNNTNYKKLQDKATIESIDDSKDSPREQPIDLDQPESFLTSYVNFINNNINNIFRKEDDIKVADAILTIFSKNETLDLSNKKAIYFYVKEITDSNTAQITRVVTKLKNVYKNLYNVYYEHGYIPLNINIYQ